MCAWGWISSSGCSVHSFSCFCFGFFSPTSASSQWSTSPSTLLHKKKKKSANYWKQERRNQERVNQQHAAIPANFTHHWIIHGQLELRGWSRLHGTSAFIYWAKQGISKLLFTARYPTACYFYAVIITLGSSRSAAEIKSIKESWEPFSHRAPPNVSRFKLGCTGTINQSDLRCQEIRRLKWRRWNVMKCIWKKKKATVPSHGVSLARSPKSGFKWGISGIMWDKY